MNKAIHSGILLLLALALLLTFAAPVLAQGQAGTTLTSEVTTGAVFERTFNWTIDKSATPDTWELFSGDTGTSQYTIAVTKDNGTDTAYMSGAISVTNGGAVATEDLAITLDLFKTGGQNPPVLNSVTVDVSSNPVLDPGETGVYPYTIAIPSPIAGATYKVTSHITIMNHSGSLGLVFGPSPSATAVFPASPNSLVNNEVNVDDTNGSSWLFSSSGSVSYEKTFSDAGVYNNTATIRETGQSDAASVTVNVYALEVSQTAATEFTRTYLWSIDKSADQSSLLLTLGQVSPAVNYSVKVTNSGYQDSAWMANGTITVSNPAPIAATINSVADILPAGVAGAVQITTAVDYPYVLPAGGNLVLDYTIALPAATSFHNAGEVVIQNFNYSAAGGAVAGSTTTFSAIAPVDFGAATIHEVDAAVSVTDTYTGNLGSVSVADSPKTFTYTRAFGPYTAYGVYPEVNIASFVTNDTAASGSDSWVVTVNVPQTGGTLTQGYWKTHSKYGPAKYDDAWALIGEDSAFFLSGKTFYQVLQTPPAGDAYYQLAHQYIAAKLNILNGTAAPSEVTAAIAKAENLFAVYRPGDIGKNQSIKKLFTDLAGLLDKYNTGLIGPGHASE